MFVNVIEDDTLCILLIATLSVIAISAVAEPIAVTLAVAFSVIDISALAEACWMRVPIEVWMFVKVIEEETANIPTAFDVSVIAIVFVASTD